MSSPIINVRHLRFSEIQPGQGFSCSPLACQSGCHGLKKNTRTALHSCGVKPYNKLPSRVITEELLHVEVL